MRSQPRSFCFRGSSCATKARTPTPVAFKSSAVACPLTDEESQEVVVYDLACSSGVRPREIGEMSSGTCAILYIVDDFQYINEKIVKFSQWILKKMERLFGSMVQSV